LSPALAALTGLAEDMATTPTANVATTKRATFDFVTFNAMCFLLLMVIL
jgi:hypothetical protein